MDDRCVFLIIDEEVTIKSALFCEERKIKYNFSYKFWE